MKRDMDLVREILLKIDASAAAPTMTALVEPGDDRQRLDFVDYQLRMMASAGLIDGIHSRKVSGGSDWLRLELTWQGHEFLDQIRDDEIWRKAKAAATKAGGFSIDLLGALAKGLIRKQIEKHTGVEIDL